MCDQGDADGGPATLRLRLESSEAATSGLSLYGAPESGLPCSGRSREFSAGRHRRVNHVRALPVSDVRGLNCQPCPRLHHLSEGPSG